MKSPVLQNPTQIFNEKKKQQTPNTPFDLSKQFDNVASDSDDLDSECRSVSDHEQDYVFDRVFERRPEDDYAKDKMYRYRKIRIKRKQNLINEIQRQKYKSEQNRYKQRNKSFRKRSENRESGSEEIPYKNHNHIQRSRSYSFSSSISENSSIADIEMHPSKQKHSTNPKRSLFDSENFIPSRFSSLDHKIKSNNLQNITYLSDKQSKTSNRSNVSNIINVSNVDIHPNLEATNKFRCKENIVSLSNTKHSTLYKSPFFGISEEERNMESHDVDVNLNIPEHGFESKASVDEVG